MCFGVLIVKCFVNTSAGGFADLDPYLSDLVICIPHKGILP